MSDKLRQADNHCLFRGEKIFNLNRFDKKINKRKKRKGLDKVYPNFLQVSTSLSLGRGASTPGRDTMRGVASAGQGAGLQGASVECVARAPISSPISSRFAAEDYTIGC